MRSPYLGMCIAFFLHNICLQRVKHQASAKWVEFLFRGPVSLRGGAENRVMPIGVCKQHGLELRWVHALHEVVGKQAWAESAGRYGGDAVQKR